MKIHTHKNSGFVLIEGLVAVVIIAFGFLAVINLLDQSNKASAQANYRAEAAFLANQLISRAWLEPDKSNDNLVAKYSSPNGAAYTDWKNSVNGQMPKAGALPPIVVVGADNTIQVTVQWQLPSETTSHNYMVQARVCASDGC